MSIGIEIVNLSLASGDSYLVLIKVSSGQEKGLWNIGVMVNFVGLIEYIADGVLGGGGNSLSWV